MLGNLTVNETQLAPSSCFSPGDLTAERIGKAVAYCLIFVVSLAGNILIGIIVYKTKTMRKTINFLIANMAMSDLLFPIFLFPWILTELYFDSWSISGPLGDAMHMCKMIPYLPNISIAVSIQSLVLIAVDRFGAVVFPFRSPIIRSKLCPYFISATWITAIILFFPNLLAFKLVEHSDKLTCELRWNEVFGKTSNNRDYLLVLLLVLYCIPFSLIITLYTIILLKLKSYKNVGERSTNAELQRCKRHRNVLKMAIAIVLVFAVCWVPLNTFYFYYLQQDHTTASFCTVKRIWFIAFFVAHANCAINPCIYFIFCGNYRQGLWSLLNCFGEYFGLVFKRQTA